MSKGIGIDIIEIQRIEKGIQEHGEHFLHRIFTSLERTYCQKFQNPYPHYAGRFAAKEAVVKALGVGFGKEVYWQDIEILEGERGKPIAQLSSKVKQAFHSPKIEISITHCKNYAAAIAFWIL